jgi:hypothetical protein
MATGKMKSNFKMPTPSAAERMNAQHQQVRKAAGLPDPSDYLKMAAQKRKEIEDMKKDQEKDKNPNQGRFSSGASKPVMKTQPLVKSESFRIGGMGSGGRGNIHMYDRNPEPRDGNELEHVPFHAKTEKQKKLQNALTDLGKKMKEIHPKLREAKDPQEYDYEGDMAKSDLRSIMHHAKELHDMIDDTTNLAEWCQSKITLSEDYLSTVANYMRSEMSEASNFITVFKKGTRMKQKINPNSYGAFKAHGFRKEETEELDEISASTKASYTSKAKEQIKQSKPFTKKGEEYRDIAKNFIARRKSGIAKANEAVEQMDELDKSTIKSYVSKKMKNSTVSNPYLNKSYKKDKENLGRAHDRLYGKKTNEAVEQIDELKKSTVASYIQKKFGKMSDEPVSKNQYGYAKKDAKGIQRAGLRMSGIKATQKEDVEQMDEADVYSIENKKTGQIYHHSKYPITKNNQKFKQIKSAGGDHVHAEIHVNGKPIKEDVEQIDEISKSLAGKYLTAPMGKGANKYKVDASKSKYPDYETMAKHATNVHRALSRSGGQAIYKKPDYYKEESLDEARPSQRHPLEGHEYHKKSNEALVHIAKDAHAAAEAMKSHNPQAENKYRDQANDSATVRHFRKTSGMPDWYKKKYGHVNESSHDVPFDKPYKKDTGTTTDKSGAKHTPMSKVRNLARQAMKKATDRKLQKEAEEPATEPFNKNSKQMSRKAQIVKGASKGNGDSFQKEPVLSASVEKNQSTN